MSANFLLLFGFINVALYLYLTLLNPQKDLKFDSEEDVIVSARHFCYELVVSLFAFISFLLCGKFVMSLVNLIPLLWESYIYGRYCSYTFKLKRKSVPKMLEDATALDTSQAGFGSPAWLDGTQTISSRTHTISSRSHSNSSDPVSSSIGVIIRDMVCSAFTELIEGVFAKIDIQIKREDNFEERREAHPFVRFYRSYEDIDSELPALLAVTKLYAFFQKGLLYITIFSFGADFISSL